MAIITTENLSNPKPVRGVDYAGQLMKSDGYYNGRPEHQSPNESAPNESNVAVVSPGPKARRKRRKPWSQEARAAMSAKIKALYQQRNPDP